MAKLDYAKAARQERTTHMVQTALTMEIAEDRALKTRGFLARHAGTCALCEHDIRPGERIESWNRAQGRYAHSRCVVTQ